MKDILEEIETLKREIKDHKCQKTNHEDDQNQRQMHPMNQQTRQNTQNPPRQYNQMIKPDISPGQGEKDDPDTIPGATWAQVVNRRRRPKIPIPEELVIENPEFSYQTDENTEKLSDEEHEQAKKALAKSALIQGLRPITKYHVEYEEKKFLEENPETELNKGQQRIKAVKNSIMRFLKDNLKMDERTRNSIQMQKIYPNDTEDFDTMYVQCKTEEDITLITKNAKNLSREGGDNRPTLVPHIPPQFFARYQACEKILHTIRASETGRYQTNLRFGKTDLMIRYREKGDMTPWSNIPTIKIPPGVPLPDVKLHKKNPKTTQNIDPKTATTQNELKKQTTTTQFNQGTVSDQLKNQLEDANKQTKRKATPPPNEKPPKTNLASKNRWEDLPVPENENDGKIITDRNRIDKDPLEQDPLDQYLDQYQQITRIPKCNSPQKSKLEEFTYTMTPIQSENGPQHG